jgi:hypothetical protein
VSHRFHPNSRQFTCRHRLRLSRPRPSI